MTSAKSAVREAWMPCGTAGAAAAGAAAEEEQGRASAAARSGCILGWGNADAAATAKEGFGAAGTTGLRCDAEAAGAASCAAGKAGNAFS